MCIQCKPIQFPHITIHHCSGPSPPPPPPPPKSASMIPPKPTRSITDDQALLQIHRNIFMDTFPPECLPYCFAWVYHYPECSLNSLIASSNIPSWLFELWTCAADNNTGFPNYCICIVFKRWCHALHALRAGLKA